MKSLKSKILALFTIACMFTGAVGVYADDYGSSTQNQTQYKVDFGTTGSWDVNGNTVTATTGGDGLVTLKGETEIREDTEITLLNFKADRMLVRVRAFEQNNKEPFFNTNLRATTSESGIVTTRLSDRESEVFPSNVTLVFDIISKPSYTVHFNSNGWMFDDTKVVATVNGKNVSDKENILETDVISLSNFDATRMSAQIYFLNDAGNKDFTKVLNVNVDENGTGTVTLAKGQTENYPSDTMYFEVVSFIPQQPSAKYKIDFDKRNWNVNGTTVTVTIENDNSTDPQIEIENNTLITLSGFKQDTMIARVYALDNDGNTFFSTNLKVFVDQETKVTSTRLSEKEVNNDYPQNATFIFEITSKPEAKYQVNFGEGSWAVNGKTVTATVNGNAAKGSIEIGENEIITLSGFDAKKMIAQISVESEKEGEPSFQTSLTVTVEEGTTTGTTTLSTKDADKFPGEGIFYFEIVNNNVSSGGGESSDGDNGIHSGYEGTTVSPKITVIGNADFYINDSTMYNSDNPDQPALEFRYDNSGHVDFYMNWFIDQRYTELKINGVDCYPLLPNPNNEGGTQALLESCRGQLYEFKITVPYSTDGYVIEAKTKLLDENDAEYMVVGNFLWSYSDKNANDDTVPDDQIIGNGKINLKSITYNGVTYSSEDKLPLWMRWNQDDFGGEAVLPTGAIVTTEMIPDYGYQLFSVGMNGVQVTAQETVSEFQFTVSGGNFHLGAKFAKTDNRVLTSSSVVAEGKSSITLNSNVVNAGTVGIVVTDNNDSKTGFDEAIKENYNDYTVGNVLDLEIKQLLYQGNEKDYWSNTIDSLNDYDENTENTAIVTLTIPSGYEDVEVVHERHDGTYEVLEGTTYNPTEGTVTFTTDSFSRFGLAYKGNAPAVMKQFTANINCSDEVIGSIYQNDQELLMNKSYFAGENDSFRIVPTERYSEEKPVVEITYFTGDEVLTKTVQLTKATDERGGYIFQTKDLNTVDRFEIQVWWSEFAKLEPNDDEFMVRINLPENINDATFRFDQTVKSSKTFENSTKYVFDLTDKESLEIEVVPAIGKVIRTIIVNGVLYGEDPNPEFSSENYPPLKDILIEGTKKFNLQINSNEEEVELFFLCTHNLIPVEGLAPTYENPGYASYYECEYCGELYADKDALLPIYDLKMWKSNEGLLLPYKNEYDLYKKDCLDQVGLLAQSGDSQAVTNLINSAKNDIESTSYNDNLTLEANKELLKNMFGTVSRKVDTQRANETQLNTYKVEKAAYVETLKVEGDSDKVAGLINEAKAAITALSYDENKSLEENKTAVDNIVTKVETDVKAQRINEAKEAFETYKTEKEQYTLSLRGKNDPQNVGQLINDANKKLMDLGYDETKSLSVNKEAVDIIVTELEKNIRNARLSSQNAALPIEGPNTLVVNVTNSADNTLSAKLQLPKEDVVETTEQVCLSLESKPADTQQTQVATGLLAESLKTFNIGTVLDLNLYQYSNLASQKDKITELEKAVTIELTLPENLINTSPNATREYRIGRIHEYFDGKVKAEELAATYDATAKTLSFVTDQFSTYVIMYRDIPKSVPDTSDQSNTALWMAVLMLSGIVAAGTVVFRRKRS